jgi:hypothetical protein
MSIEQTLQNEIEESKRWLEGPIDDTIYRRDLGKRIELINWVLENMKNPDNQVCNSKLFIFVTIFSYNAIIKLTNNC